MTFDAERSLVLYGHPLIVAGMGSVAIQAKSLRKGLMSDIALHFFHEIAMARFAELLPRRLEQFPLGRAVSIMA